MDKFTLLKNGLRTLPPGFRFHPTDEELLVQYLKRKVLSQTLPAAIIQEFDVCKSDPWDLPGGAIEEERYFFTIKEVKYRNGKRANRATGSGYWKATGLDKPIVSPTRGVIVGTKKTLVFYKGKPPKGCRTDWVMHEYRLSDSETAPPEKNWVVCRIFMKKRNNKIEEEEAAEPVLYDFFSKSGGGGGGAEEISGLSGVTEVDSNSEEMEENEENSCCDSWRIGFGNGE